MRDGWNVISIVVGCLILAAVICAVIAIIRAKKSGKSGCGGNCAGCAMRGSCHQNTSGGKEKC